MVMSVLPTGVDPRAPWYLEHRSIMLERLGHLSAAVAAAAGSESHPAHRADRRKPTPRQRVELLVDPDTPLLELSPTVGVGTGYAVGAGLITAVGVVEGALCLIAADNAPFSHPTAGHELNPFTMVKAARAVQIARANALPLIHLCDNRGHSRTMGIDSLFPDGSTCRDFTDCSADHARDTIRSVRRVIGRLACGAASGSPARLACPPAVVPPIHDQADLLALAPPETPGPFDPREILGRVFDGSRFDEFDEFERRPRSALCAGWGAIHRHPVAVLSDGDGEQHVDDLAKGLRFVQLAESAGIPLLLLLRGASVRSMSLNRLRHDGNRPASPLIETVAGARVPHLIVSLGPTPSAGDAPRFHFRWPTTHDCDTDDGTIDPRDTRTVLGLCLAVIAGTSTRQRR